jgi:transcriptional regulator with XRE-family HTH domain
VATSVVASRIKQRLGDLEISKAEFARRCKVTKSTVTVLLQGTHEPHLKTLRRAAKVLDCSLGYLLGIEAQP